MSALFLGHPCECGSHSRSTMDTLKIEEESYSLRNYNWGLTRRRIFRIPFVPPRTCMLPEFCAKHPTTTFNTFVEKKIKNEKNGKARGDRKGKKNRKDSFSLALHSRMPTVLFECPLFSPNHKFQESSFSFSGGLWFNSCAANL